ncbi:MAG TPA: hypothetical protein DCM28_17955 [Phycisphaerales bacterium]|nr:hypothetical protein [Phycisphaerales bacterium]HCD35042.1 hypothetical protein [Phycisphaerales bacterium]|tara:strand:+ start:855 stop:1277 length:423 start_codon:yes stop_codon:yes gene_type:complete
MVERKAIKHVSIPGMWGMSAAVYKIEGTRWYVEEGPVPHFRQWLKELNKEMRKETGSLLLPMQWVPMYVGVSRAAVKKRAETGGLTVFSYKFIQRSRTLLGKETYKETRKQIDLVPYSECDQWREILLDIQEARNEFEAE